MTAISAFSGLRPHFRATIIGKPGTVVALALTAALTDLGRAWGNAALFTGGIGALLFCWLKFQG